jgi:hypothetical protein
MQVVPSDRLTQNVGTGPSQRTGPEPASAWPWVAAGAVLIALVVLVLIVMRRS